MCCLVAAGAGALAGAWSMGMAETATVRGASDGTTRYENLRRTEDPLLKVKKYPKYFSRRLIDMFRKNVLLKIFAMNIFHL